MPAAGDGYASDPESAASCGWMAAAASGDGLVFVFEFVFESDDDDDLAVTAEE